MVEQPPQRQIKIKITHPGARREEPVQEYVYHWDRIIGALAALLLLLGTLGYGIFAWLTPSSPLAETAVHERQLQDQMVVAGPPQRQEAANAAASLSSGRPPAMVPAGRSEATRPLDLADAPVGNTPGGAMPPPREPPTGLHTEHLPMAPGQVTPAPPAEIPDTGGGLVQGEASERSPSPEVAPSKIKPPTARPAAAPAVAARMSASRPNVAEPRRREEEPLSEPVPKSSAAEASAMPSGEATDAAPEPDSGDVVADSGVSSPRSDRGLIRSTKMSIASPVVKRFVLAQDVVSNEPQGDLGDVALNDAGYAAVSSFSEVTGQQGETLQYRWLHKGKEVLRIRVPVGSNRWRSHSTKRIYAAMKGGWRAELRNSAGELLASIDFVF